MYIFIGKSNEKNRTYMRILHTRVYSRDKYTRQIFSQFYVVHNKFPLNVVHRSVARFMELRLLCADAISTLLQIRFALK